MTLQKSILAALALSLLLGTACSKKPQRRGDDMSAYPPPSGPIPGPAAAPGAEPSPAAAATPAVPVPVPAAEPSPEPAPKRKSYIVQKGDSLWKIAGRKEVQGDSFLWPLLFKANRDQISDPDLIEPRQDLTWKPAYSSEEVRDARTKSGDTPAFKPHAKPRKTLPLKY